MTFSYIPFAFATAITQREAKIVDRKDILQYCTQDLQQSFMTPRQWCTVYSNAWMHVMYTSYTIMYVACSFKHYPSE